MGEVLKFVTSNRGKVVNGPTSSSPNPARTPPEPENLSPNLAQAENYFEVQIMPEKKRPLS